MRGIELLAWLVETAKHYADADAIIVCFLRRGDPIEHAHAEHWNGEGTSVELLGMLEKAKLKLLDSLRADAGQEPLVEAKSLLES
jgi:hypothetical protein